MNSLTADEKRLLRMTGEVWNTWCELPGRSSDDNDEFQRAIHAAQHLIALRVARRVDPEIWRQPTVAVDPLVSGNCRNCWKCLYGKHNPDTGMLITSERMITCPECGNKRCPKASDHTLDCTGSNEMGQPGSVYRCVRRHQKS